MAGALSATTLRIALQAWNTFSLHVPLVGQATGAATGTSGVQTTSDPGPLEFWLLAPFVHLDPGQGVLIGSAVLCAAALSFGLYVLQKSVGLWAAVVLALVVADLAIVSPLSFTDPVWNSDFASFWFLSFLAVAFSVGLGNMRYLPFLLFIGSVTIDSHLLFLPSVAVILIAVVVCGLLLRRPDNYRWLWWTIGVAVACWIAPLYQQLFGSHPNLTALLHSIGVGTAQPVKTFSSELGLRALARAASPKAVWATARPTQPDGSYADVLNGGHLVYCFAFVALVALGVLAWRHKKTYLLSLSVVTTASAIGLVILYARVPENYILSFQWISLLTWVVGICLWLTLGYGVVVWARSRLSVGWKIRVPPGVVKASVLVLMAIATVAATAVVMFPYGQQGQRLVFGAMQRVEREAGIVETYVPKGKVGLAVRYSGLDFLQRVEDERGTAYLLRTDGWIPGLPASANGLLNLPIDPNRPFVLFNEQQAVLTGFKVYNYSNLQIIIPQSAKNAESAKKLQYIRGLIGSLTNSTGDVPNLGAIQKLKNLNILVQFKKENLNLQDLSKLNNLKHLTPQQLNKLKSQKKAGASSG